MTDNRFTDLDLDPSPAVAPVVAGNAKAGQSRWTHPEVDGVSVPVFDSFKKGTSFGDYVVSDGPCYRALVEKGHHYPILLENIALASGRYCPNLKECLAVIDSKTGRKLGRIVKKGYHVAQNATLAALLDAIVPEDAPIELFSFNQGERLAFRVPLDAMKGKIDDAIFKDEGATRKHGYKRWFDNSGDPALAGRWFLLMMNTHGGGGKLIARLERRVWACTNGQVTDLIKGGFAFVHTARLDERLERARRAFLHAARKAQAFSELFSKMFATTMNATQFSEFMDIVLPETKACREKEQTRANGLDNRAAFERVYHEAPGAAPGKVIGAVNAHAYWKTHKAKVGVTGARANASFADGLVGPAAVEVRAPVRRYELQLFGRSQDATNERAMQWCTLAVN